MHHSPRLTENDVNDYRDIAGFPGYRIGSDGSIWSTLRGGTWKRRATFIDKHGYVVVRLSAKGRVLGRKVHRLVMQAFVGPCPEGMEVAHRNGKKNDPRLSNLRYDTHKGNHADRSDHGTSNAGTTNGMSRLTENAIRKIRKDAAAGIQKSVLIAEHGVGRRAIERIVRKERWGHIE